MGEGGVCAAMLPTQPVLAAACSCSSVQPTGSVVPQCLVVLPAHLPSAFSFYRTHEGKSRYPHQLTTKQRLPSLQVFAKRAWG